jgi:hypothetical protein
MTNEITTRCYVAGGDIANAAFYIGTPGVDPAKAADDTAVPGP